MSQAPLVTLLLLSHQLLASSGYPSNGNRKNTYILCYLAYHYFAVPDWKSVFLRVLIPLSITEATPVTLISGSEVLNQGRILCKHSCPACAGPDCWHPLTLSIFCVHDYGSLCFAKPPKMENLPLRRLKRFLKGNSPLGGLHYLKFKFSSCSGQGKSPAKSLPQYNGIDQQIPNAMEASAGQKCSFSVLFRNCSEMDFVRRRGMIFFFL